MVQLDAFTRLLYIGLWTAADDHGAIRDELDRIAMEIMPREDPDNVKHSIDLLIACGRITRMLNDDGSSYLIIEKWAEHQRVDKPAKSKIIREGSRKLAISPETRRAVAAKYGCAPGERKEATCYFCGCPGEISWPRLYSGKPSSWVSFCDLELDHFQSESKDGDNSSSNLVLSCRHCNRARNNKSAFDFVTKGLGSVISPNAREDSRELMVGKDQGKDQGKEKRESNAREPPVDNYGGSEPEKFRMHADWQPVAGFAERGHSWGHNLGDPPYTVAQLQQFRDYWSQEATERHHQQWEMAFAESLERQKSMARPAREKHDINTISKPDYRIPPGFRGYKPDDQET